MMNLVSAEYANAEGDAITADLQDGSTKAILQRDSENWAWITSQQDVAIGPYQAPPPDPDGDLAREREGMIVSAFQAKAALQAAGLYISAETAVNAAGGITLLAWQTAIEYRRNSPTIAALQVTLGLTDAQVDDLFRAAALIDA